MLYVILLTYSFSKIFVQKIIESIILQNGISFNEAVYNETVQIIELDDGLDGETIFLYVFLAACVILTLVGGQQLLSSLGRKSRSSSNRKTPVEMGTSNPNNVDYDWLPKETLNRISKYYIFYIFFKN